MTQEKVEVVKSGLAAWNAGDMEELRELWHPDATLHPPEGWPEKGPFSGREAVFRQFEVLREAWQDADVLVADEIAGHGDCVVVSLHWRGSGHGPELDMEMTGNYTVRNGLIVACEFFWGRAEALKAAGASR